MTSAADRNNPTCAGTMLAQRQPFAGVDAKLESPLEPAIPSHLREYRTQPLNKPEGFSPTTPSYSARFDAKVKILPMAFVGVQHKTPSTAASSAIDAVKAAFQSKSGPPFWDRAEYVDELGYSNTVLVGYWTDKDASEDWQHGLPTDWWHPNAKIDGGIGFFRECYTPSVGDTETTFSHQHPEGYSRLAGHMSGMTDTHGYWGSARDRIPRSQTDPMSAAGVPIVTLSSNNTLGRHLVVKPHDNVCLLRSGQDWSETGPEERAFYLERVRPALDRGMNFIRDEGRSVGCYFNRYMTVLSETGSKDRTYSLSAWHSLKHLETWVKTDSHLEIFAAGTRHYRTFPSARLRLYHEMSVIRAEDQQFEYFNCHHRTGMLNAAEADFSQLTIV